MTDILRSTAEFWQRFYEARKPPTTPSPFAQWCLDAHHITPDDHVLELGCGSGRDSFAFLKAGIPTTAIDGSHAAIAQNRQRYEEHGIQTPAQFEACHFGDLGQLDFSGITAIYSRFVLHAVPEKLEDALLDFAKRILPQGGRMLHEFRTQNDPLMGEGEAISGNERITDHYRRFLKFEHFRGKLAQRGWVETYTQEANGLAVFGTEDPVVARIICTKK